MLSEPNNKTTAQRKPFPSHKCMVVEHTITKCIAAQLCSRMVAEQVRETENRRKTQWQVKTRNESPGGTESPKTWDFDELKVRIYVDKTRWRKRYQHDLPKRRKKCYQMLRSAVTRVQGVTEPEVTTKKSRIKKLTERDQKNRLGVNSDFTQEEMKQMCQETGQKVTKNKIGSWKRQVNQVEPGRTPDKRDLSQEVRPRAHKHAEDKDKEKVNGSDKDAKKDRQPEVLPDEAHDGLLWARSSMEDENGAAVLASSGNQLETQKEVMKQLAKIQDRSEKKQEPPMTTSSADRKTSAEATVLMTEALKDNEMGQPKLERKLGELIGHIVAEMQQLQTRMIKIENKQRQLTAVKQTLAEEQMSLVAAQEAEAKAQVVWQEAQKTLAEARKRLDRRRRRRELYGSHKRRLSVPGNSPEKGDDKSKGEEQPETSFTFQIPGGQLGDEPRAGDDGQCFRCGGIHGTSQCPIPGNHQTKILTDGSGKNGKALDMVSFTAAGGARDGEDYDLRMLEVSAGHGQLPTRDWLDRGREKGKPELNQRTNELGQHVLCGSSLWGEALQ